MALIPSMLLRQLYTFGSLKNTGQGVQFAIKNRLSDAEVVGHREEVPQQEWEAEEHHLH